MNHSDTEHSSRIRLLEAAIICFSEKGYDATGIRDIALLAKANSALVQYHFGGKTGLYGEALKYIFNSHPHLVPPPPEDDGTPEARPRAIRSLGALVENLLDQFMACSEHFELDQAAHLLVTRELQSPRQEVVDLILEHLRPHMDHMMACIRILRPDLDRLEALDYLNSIYGQILQFHNNLKIIRLVRGQPDYPQDLQAVARHIVEFSLRGLAIPEAFPGA